MFGLSAHVPTSSLNILCANSTQYTFPSGHMSATWDGVVPLDAPRYRTLLSDVNGNLLPPLVMYAESLLLRGSHSLYSVPDTVVSLSP